MGFRPLKSRLWAYVLVSGLSVVAPAHALEDVLQTPAMMSEKAAQTLLLDVKLVGQRLVAVGQRGHIVYSENKGRSWKQAKVPVSVALTAVHFATPTHGWAVGHSGVVLHSKDGGKTWEKQLDGIWVNQLVVEQNRQQVAELEALLETADEDEVDELEMSLEDAQMALEDSEVDAEDGPSKPFLDVWFKDENTGFVVGAYGLFFGTSDGGQTWTNYGRRLENPDRLHLNAIAQVTGGAVFIVGESGEIHLSTDEGQSWERLKSPYTGSLFNVMGTGAVNEVLVMGLRGSLFRSENLGKTWERVKSGVDSTLNGGANTNDGKVVIVGNSGVVLTSKNFGQSFDAFVRPDRQSMAATAIVDANTLVVVSEDGAIRTDRIGKNL